MPKWGEMEYYDSTEGFGGAADWAARKYHGSTARTYDAKRQESPKWQAENRIVRGFLADLPSGTTVLDCPVGTGRFLPLYQELGLKVIGVDVSEDMLMEAAKLAGDAVQLGIGNILRLPGEFTGRFDVGIMVRITRWLMEHPRGVRNEGRVAKALQEMARCARRRLIVTVRVRNHPFCCPYELIAEALPSWKIVKDEAADGEDYRVLMLEP